MIDISIIIPNYNTKNLLKQLIDSIYNNDTIHKLKYEIIVVDNNSSDGSVEYIKSLFKDIKLISNKKNLGYAKAVNQGYKISRGEFIIICNSDIIVPKEFDFIRLINKFKSDEDIGVMGPQLLYKNGSWQRSYGNVPNAKSALKDLLFITKINELIEKINFKLNKQKEKQVSYIVGAFLIVRRSVFERLNGWDESFFFYAEDCDFCYRTQIQGFKVLFVPSFKVIHIGGSSSSAINVRKYKQIQARSNLLFVKKHFKKDLPKYILYRKIFCWIRLVIYYIVEKIRKKEVQKKFAFIGEIEGLKAEEKNNECKKNYC
ncbi:hypothetical protein O163_03720 [Caldanaerobacter subterraneus subsp. yonseiensis KB-1]|uniref:Glycosyltransferase 2-like domain-containing protein n=1 Tax=Caldanaerobacter subterraneus subsp. yonseiensis KB-1 TaxID=1388761 RepID=U5CXG7_CALSX|nr:glycosyltransferase family 2 protein [Caldanaerobacter subterraneus]ERM92717.1 hypothetical protein O163_03720 [Caldanaerobacter subterraneus subsp. yonseiensis KB-1]